MDGPTNYIEANALLAAQENDTAEMDRLVRQLLPNERSQLYGACERLLDSLDHFAEEAARPIPPLT